MSYAYPDKKERIIAAMNAFATCAMDLGAAPRELHGWIDMLAGVRELRDGPREPNHAEDLRHVVEALCWFAPCVGVSLDDVRGWVDGRIEFRRDIQGIMQRLRREPEVFETTFAPAAQEGMFSEREPE
ncbi:MAG: hypothetical protein FWF60_02830 [Oscillospiraceae bacterium]|nr:hypothetical protein [Oscillospiraceae bacterium]